MSNVHLKSSIRLVTLIMSGVQARVNAENAQPIKSITMIQNCVRISVKSDRYITRITRSVQGRYLDVLLGLFIITRFQVANALKGDSTSTINRTENALNNAILENTTTTLIENAIQFDKNDDLILCLIIGIIL